MDILNSTLKAAFICLLGSFAGNATTIFSSTCSVSTLNSQMNTSGTDGCSTSTTDGTASASASVNSSIQTLLATNPVNYSQVHTFQQTNVKTANSQNVAVGAYAESSLILNENLTTSGDVRSGILQIEVSKAFSYGPAPDTGFGGGAFDIRLVLQSLNPAENSPISFPYHPLNCSFSAGQCDGQAAMAHYMNEGGLLVQLGTPFSLTFDSDIGSDNSFAGPYFGDGSGILDLTYKFRFLELDGITPVAVLDVSPTTTVEPVPEPGTYWLTLCVGLAIVLASRTSKVTLAPTSIQVN